ncbi:MULTISPECIES: dTDP-4-dehydrorhamnose reductase [Raoultella]|uniref:dTDP-4-dehydrorhamnose reductase n=1 Tax=Raoultella TaxID=160674 RepID=UPI0004E3F0BE|nr:MULTISPECIES: dTDP-4-dehydrorhamnose reductase [Raoultella]KFD08383.1 dTDP-4-dehydrorhamnose reductase [Raoultella planticola ATCC 33531]
MKVLLTGAKGQLGNCFIDRMPKEWQVIATDSNDLDITNESQVTEFVEEMRPDVIVNAAAYTAVDKAEEQINIARLVNTNGPMYLAAAAKAFKARFVHVSTDYVFDGTQATPYTEDDLPNPLGVYGRTKLDGEVAVSEVYPDAIIIRTAWVFSEYGNNFLKTMLRLASEREQIGVVDDQYGCPTYAGDIATAIIQLLIVRAPGGIYHFCGDEEMSWREFAEQIIIELNKENKIKNMPVINRLTTEQYPTLAKRPKYSTLDCKKINGYDIKPSNFNVNVSKVINSIYQD